MNIRRLSGVILLGLLFLIAVAGGYLYFSKVLSKERPAVEEIVGTSTKAEDLFPLRIYYPQGNRLQMEERRLPRRTVQIAIAEATVEEYFKGPKGVTVSNMPRDVRLLGLYKDADSVLYIDLSDEFRRNFQGDAITEILLLKGLYESLISNIQDIQDVKVLIEGKEIETIGGHLYLLYPLKDMGLPETNISYKEINNNGDNPSQSSHTVPLEKGG